MEAVARHAPAHTMDIFDGHSAGNEGGSYNIFNRAIERKRFFTLSLRRETISEGSIWPLDLAKVLDSMHKKITELLLCILICLFTVSSIYANDNIEKAGDILQLALPATAYGMTFVHECQEERIDSSKSNLVKSSVSMISGDIWHVASSPFRMSKNDAIRLASLAALGASSIIWFDNAIDEEFALEGHNTYLKPAKGLVSIGEAYDRIGPRRAVIVLSGAMLTGGLILKDKKLLETTRLMIESSIIAGAITYWGKGLIGRSRPYTDRGAHDFNLLKFSKLHEFRALPSGHATSVFSMMTIIAKQYDRWWIEIPAYTLAVSVALQRMNSRKHWTSDVLVGGAIGHWVASTLVNRHKNRSQEASISLHFSGDRVAVNIRF